MNQDPSLIVTEDVDGAPVRMLATVRIVRTDPDDPIAERFLGRVGVVVALVFDDPRTQYPADPLIQVRVPGLGEDLFFSGELELAPEWTPREHGVRRTGRARHFVSDSSSSG